MRARSLVITIIAAACLGGPVASAGAAHLYWSESNSGIQRVDELGQDQKTIDATAGLIALDDAHVYSAYYNSGNWLVRRTDLDGANPVPTWLTIGTGTVTSLAAGGGHVCWARNYNQPGGYAKYEAGCAAVGDDGTAGPPQVVHDDVNGTILNVAADHDHLYWTQGPLIANGQPGSIARADFDGQNLNPALISGIYYPRGLAANGTSVFWTSSNPQSDPVPPVEVASVPRDGGGKQTIVTLDGNQSISAVAATNTHVYWVESADKVSPLKRVGTATLQGGNVNHTFLDRPNTVGAIATEGSGECTDTINFKTSMVATGCFLPNGDHKWKAVGPFRMDGIDFKSLDDTNSPVVFDTEAKTVDGDAVEMSLTAPGYGSGWLAFTIPGGVHLSFPYDNLTLSWALKDPRAATNPILGALGFLQLTGGLSPTLFGFPVQSPGAEVVFTTGRADVTLQMSFPTTSKAYIDHQGLWKVPTANGGSRTSYPTGLKVKISANNSDGVTFVEGTFSPADVYGVDVEQHKRRIVWGGKGAPSSSVIEVAKIHVGWEIAKGVIHAGGVLVFHTAPGEAASSWAKGSGFFIGRPNLDTDVAFQWGNLSLGGETYRLPFPKHISTQIQSLNRPVYPPWQLYWQRAGAEIGVDVDNPAHPYQLAASLGFSFLPRFKHDFLWFQELASLDARGVLEVAPFAVYGTADLKVANANIVHGEFSADSDGIFLEGDSGLDFSQLVRIPFPLKVRGQTIWAFATGAGWGMAGDVSGSVWKFNARGDLLWNADGLGFCIKTGQLRDHGVYFDGKWHEGGCNEGPFADPATAHVKHHGGGRSSGGGKGEKVGAAAANPSFTVTRSSKLSSVAIRGATAPPKVRLTGPGGLSLTVPDGEDAAAAGDTVMALNPSDKTTYITFQKTPPGTYKIDPLPGSSKIKSVDYAADLPAPRVSARVKAKSCVQDLSWKLKPLPGQKVTFLETGAKGDRPILTTAKASGHKVFTPLVGTATKRTIIARVEQEGTQRLERKVATFKAANADNPAAVRGLKGKRKGNKVTVKWGAVCGAPAYLVTTTVGTTTAEVIVEKKTSATLALGKNATITVAAIGALGTPGKAAKIKVK